MRFERDGITGSIIEEELLGKSNYESITHTEFPDWRFIQPERIRAILKKMQPFPEPTDPVPDFASHLHSFVSEGLGVEIADLRYYTAVRSPYDKQGVDAWFEVEYKGVTLLVTFDVTSNLKKGDQYKADIVFLVPHDGLDRKVDKEQFMDYSHDLANQVVEHFKKWKGYGGTEH